MAGPLDGQVAVVAGGTRGAGRGISVQLGTAGATVYVTGRTTREGRSPLNRPETIEETAELVDAAGGRGIPVRVDHMDPAQVAALADRIRAEQDGRLDILVNDVWGGERFIIFGKPFWEQPLAGGLEMVRNAVDTHLISSHTLVPLMVARGRGLVIEVTDGDHDRFRNNVFYDLAKMSVIRLAFGQAEELRPHGVHAIAVTPGFLRSEEMLAHFGVTEANWRDGIRVTKEFAMSETPQYVGRAVAALAADPDAGRYNGKVVASWTLAKEYGFTDLDGSRPDWGGYFEELDAGREPDPADHR
jgi:NAD(P)-dependent dehydrogenase (short-subunit alcohol dehydrogenase family)